MFMGFENAKKRTGFAARIFAYILAMYSLTIKRQNKQIHNLKGQLKPIVDERENIAKLLEEGISHPATDCDNLCESHLQIRFIRHLNTED